MDRSAADAYVYAKVCGIISKSYSGINAEKLFAVKSLSELYSLLFDGEVPAVPETLLAKEIEKQAEEHFVRDYESLLNCYEKPEKLLVHLLQYYDYKNLQEIAGALCMQETEEPELTDLRNYALLNYKAWPDIKKITENSPLSWYNRIPDITEQQLMDTKLDFQYLRELWEYASKMPYSIRKDILNVFALEFSFNNILWAIRLRYYYEMPVEEILTHLFFKDTELKKKKKKAGTDLFAGEAVKLLEKDMKNFDDWKDWKYRDFLNPNEEGVLWEIDPPWLESKIHQTMIKNYSLELHKFPLSPMVLVCYFKIKENELDNIRRITEGLRLGGE